MFEKLARTRQTIVNVAILMLLAMGVAWAAQTNYLGTVFIADSTTPANQLTITSGGSMKTTGWSSIASVSFTRPANTTTYTANTAWANATSGAVAATIPSVCERNGQQVLIPQIDIMVDEAPATKLQGILWLFSSAGVTPINDNAAFTLAAADNLVTTGNVQGFPFTLTAVQSGTNAYSSISLTGTTYHAQCITSGTSIIAMVQVTNAYVPTNGETMTIKIHALGAN